MRLISRLPQISGELRPAMREAVALGAEQVVEAAKQRVPVNTGRLRDAIHVEEQPEGVYVIAGDKEAWYGHLVEHGTSHTAPRPFLVPALEEQRGVMEAEALTAIRRIA